MRKRLIVSDFRVQLEKKMHQCMSLEQLAIDFNNAMLKQKDMF